MFTLYDITSDSVICNHLHLTVYNIGRVKNINTYLI